LLTDFILRLRGCDTADQSQADKNTERNDRKRMQSDVFHRGMIPKLTFISESKRLPPERASGSPIFQFSLLIVARQA
jgi:chloramphenicol O-acetyltransferase